MSYIGKQYELYWSVKRVILVGNMSHITFSDLPDESKEWHLWFSAGSPVSAAFRHFVIHFFALLEKME